MFAFFASLLLLSGVALARIRNYTLDITDAPVSLDGYQRNAIIVNGITPGEILVGEKGDTLMINVNNGLSDPNMRRSTSIHWHGILQHRTAFDDGPAGVTQCPIAPEHFYKYRVELEQQAGTFWYHSHLGTQYIDGLRGPLIVYDPKDPHGHLYDIDNPSTVVTLTDWYHDYSSLLMKNWVADKIPEPAPDSTLLNGIGRYNGGPPVQRAVIRVTQGRRYRFRLINMGAILKYTFAIEGHLLTVIEVDGINHQPQTVSSLPISPGQRFSVVVNAYNDISNYWVAYPSIFLGSTTTPANPNYNGTEAFAVLRYQGAPEEEPQTPQIIVESKDTDDDSGMLKEHQLKPLVNNTPPGGNNPDVVITLNFTTTKPGTATTPGVGNRWLVNGIQYESPKIPALLAILSGTSDGDEDSYVLPVNKSIEIRLSGDQEHPFHLHGHTFSVIQSATGPKNLIDPPVRDTVETSNDLQNPVTIRFNTDNPGPWLLHCHKDWHFEVGLAVVFIEDPEAQRVGPLTLQPSKGWNKLCPIYYALSPELQ